MDGHAEIISGLKFALARERSSLRRRHAEDGELLARMQTVYPIREFAAGWRIGELGNELVRRLTKWSVTILAEC